MNPAQEMKAVISIADAFTTVVVLSSASGLHPNSAFPTTLIWNAAPAIGCAGDVLTVVGPHTGCAFAFANQVSEIAKTQSSLRTGARPRSESGAITARLNDLEKSV